MRLMSLLRMSLWARKPPSRQRIIMVATVLAVIVLIAGLEMLGWWPDALTAHKMAP